MEKTQTALQILLVDADERQLEALQQILEQCRVLNGIVKFGDGSEAMAFLREACGSGRRFLILMDLLTNSGDGISVLRQMQAEKLAEGSVIVMLSGLTDVKLLHAGYQLGAQTFMIKPIKPRDFMDLLVTLKQFVLVESEPKGNRLVWNPAFKPSRA